MEKLHCLCVIQARRTSSRLPDKILMPLGGVPVLRRVIERCQRITGVDKVVVAIPEGDYNKPLADLAYKSGAEVIAGSEQDVLSRYVAAYQMYPADHIMRVTSDCPLLDPEICQDLLNGVETRGADYGATAWWPHGLDCEVMTAHALEAADRNATSALDREHVTLWIKRQTDMLQYIHKAERDYLPEQRWVLDYPEDLEFLEALCEKLPAYPEVPSWREILRIVGSDAMLGTINRERIAEWGAHTKKIYQDASSKT